ncbi:hypothetical protein D3C76_1781040 [compost metagenome]
MAGQRGGQQRNQNAGLFNAHRCRAGGIYELHRGGGDLYSGGAERLDAHADLALAPDDAAQLRRADQRHDDAGGDAAEPGS